MMEPVEFPEISANTADNSSWAACGTKMQREHHIVNSLYIEAKDLEEQVKARYERYAVVEANETDAETYLCDDADIVITAFGACSRIAKSAVNKARAEGIKAGLFRPITLWPFPKNELLAATKNAKAVLSVEMNMGQMVDDVKLALDCKIPVSFFGRTGGIIPSPNEVLAELRKLNGGAQ
jgi:2-oxoglutarate ferredoxin oxidoreductase subunit alpha